MKKHDYKHVYKLLKPYLFKEFIWLLISFMHIMLTLATPYIIKQIIDVSIMNKDLHSLYINIVLYIGVLILSQIVVVIRTLISSYIGERLLYDFRMDLYRNISQKSILFFNDKEVGEITSRVLYELPNIVSLVAGTPIRIITQVSTFIVTLGVMLSINWIITLSVIIVIPFIYLLFKIYNPKFQKIDTLLMEQQAKINNTIQENIINTKIIKYLQRFKYGEYRFSTALHKAIKLRFEYLHLNIKNSNYMAIIYNFPTVVLYSIGGYLVIKGQLSLGSMVAMLSYIANLFSPVTDLVNLNIDLQNSLATLDRYNELILESNENNSGSFALKYIKRGVKIENMTFSYPGKAELFSKVNLTIPLSKVLYLSGSNGTGKSTFIDLMCGILKPDSGCVKYDDIEINNIRKSSLKGLIGIVPQSVYLFNDTVRNNIKLGRNIKDEDIIKLSNELGFNDVVSDEKVNLDTIVSNYGNNLSGGQRQKISILRALIIEHKILILDEVSTFLDKNARDNLFNYLNNNKENKLLVVVSHEDKQYLKEDIVFCFDSKEELEVRV